LKTGACFEYEDIKIDTFPVRIDNNRVAVKIEAE
jgi:nitrite reductase (NADH) small subunit